MAGERTVRWTAGHVAVRPVLGSGRLRGLDVDEWELGEEAAGEGGEAVEGRHVYLSVILVSRCAVWIWKCAVDEAVRR